MNIEDSIRTFFAIDLPKEINPLIADIIHQLQKTDKYHQVRWVKAAHLHITLQFIAAIKSEDVDTLINRVRENIKNISSFPLKLTELELFPTSFRPHVISIGMTSNDELATLAQAIGQAVSSCGYPIETRPFRSHLTLGRIKEGNHAFELGKIAIPDFKEFLVKEIILYRSEATSKEPSYYKMATFHLPE